MGLSRVSFVEGEVVGSAVSDGVTRAACDELEAVAGLSEDAFIELLRAYLKRVKWYVRSRVSRR